MKLPEKNIYLFMYSILFMVILLAACSEGIPSESNARSVFENEHSENIKNGFLKIDAFSKTNGQKMNIDGGVEAYKIEYTANVTYPKGILPECIVNGFNWPPEIFYKCQNAFETQDSYKVFKQPGQKEIIRGELLFEKTEKGWKGEDGNIY